MLRRATTATSSAISVNRPSGDSALQTGAQIGLESALCLASLGTKDCEKARPTISSALKALADGDAQTVDLA